MSLSSKLGKFMLMLHKDTSAPILPSTWRTPLTAAQDTEYHQWANMHISYRRAIDLHEKKGSIFSEWIMLVVHVMVRELQLFVQALKWLLHHPKEAEDVGVHVTDESSLWWKGEKARKVRSWFYWGRQFSSVWGVIKDAGPSIPI